MFRTEQIGDARLILGDCLDVMPSLTSCDLALTDPPYNCGKAYSAHDDNMLPDEYRKWLGRRFRALATEQLVYTPGDRHFWDAPAICDWGGFQLNRTLAWHKKEFAGDKWTAGPAMCWEPVVWASRIGTRKYFNKIFGTSGRDCLVVNATHGDPWAREHPCPKPLPVMAWLVGLFCPEGGSVIDPFMGTGCVGAACALLGRSFVGIEIDRQYFDIACRRIEEAYRQRDLFIAAPAPIDLPTVDLFVGFRS